MTGSPLHRPGPSAANVATMTWPPGFTVEVRCFRYKARSAGSVRKWKVARSCQMSTRFERQSPVTSARNHVTALPSAPSRLRAIQRRFRDVEHRQAGESAADEMIHEAGIPASHVNDSRLRGEAGRIQQLERRRRRRLKPAGAAAWSGGIDPIPMIFPRLISAFHVHLIDVIVSRSTFSPARVRCP